MSITAGIALSLHIGLAGDYNEIHPYVRYESNDYVIGAYYNSEGRISNYIGYNYDMTDRTSIDIGIVSGYTSYDIIPMVRLIQDETFFISPAIEYTDNYDVSRIGFVIGIQF